AMFPILVWVYVRLARREENASRAEFGPAWDAYARAVPAFIPRIGIASGPKPHHPGAPSHD
ncbi:MAG: isoprenylcysteine carboxyl methyltransferase, partial [Rhizobiales bacterium 35-68-8]